jgi:hypothetical protein
MMLNPSALPNLLICFLSLFGGNIRALEPIDAFVRQNVL